MKDALSRVAEGIYQVCGVDAPHLTIVEGDRGVIIIDPTGDAALDPYRQHRGDRPVTGVIYTHAAGDRFGPADEDVSILAPAGLLQHAASEITHTGQEETVDGVRLVLQVGQGLNFLVPQRRALFIGRNTTHPVLTETIALFGAEADVIFASHHRPISQNILRYLSQLRDAHAYLHDQTLRLLHQGHTGTEIAELVQLPPALEKAWQEGGRPESVAQAVAAIYRRRLGGSEPGLWLDPPPESAKRYVAGLGGAAGVATKAREFADAGDLGFAARLLRHAVAADPESEAAKELLAQVYENLGHGTESPAWRDCYLTAAQELRYGVTLTPAAALSLEQIFDTVAVRVDAPAAWQENVTIDWVCEDRPYRTALRHGVLIHHPRTDTAEADLTLRLTKAELLGVLAGQGLRGVRQEGDPEALKRLLSHLDPATMAVA